MDRGRAETSGGCLVTFAHGGDLLPSGVGVGQQELGYGLQGDERRMMRTVLELVSYDGLELLAERLAIEYGGDALAGLHLTHVLFDVRWPLQLAPVVGIFGINVLDELARTACSIVSIGGLVERYFR